MHVNEIGVSNLGIVRQNFEYLLSVIFCCPSFDSSISPVDQFISYFLGIGAF